MGGAPWLVLASLAACVPDIGFRDHTPARFHFQNVSADYLVDGPYAAGSRLNLWVVGNPRFSKNFRVQVADSDAFQIEEEQVYSGEIHLIGRALASTELQVVRRSNDAIVTTLPIEVAHPASISLRSQALVAVGVSESMDTLHVLEHVQDATISMTPHDRFGQRLYGDGGLALGQGSPSTVSLELHDEADREPFLKVDTESPGLSFVTLDRMGDPFTTVPLQVVSPEEVVQIELVSNLATASESSVVTVAVVARTAEAKLVLGYTPVWHLDGGAEDGAADLYTYQRQTGVFNTLVARDGSLEASLEIEGTPRGQGVQTSSCSTAESRPLTLLGMFVVGAFARRRHCRISLSAE